MTTPDIVLIPQKLVHIPSMVYVIVGDTYAGFFLWFYQIRSAPFLRRWNEDTEVEFDILIGPHI